MRTLYESILDDDDVVMSNVKNSVLIEHVNKMLEMRIKDPKLIKTLESKVAVYPISDDSIKNTINSYIDVVGNKCSLNWIDTSNVKDMSYMFYKSQFNGDISKWNTSKVKDMSYMFDDCSIKDKYRPKFK